MNDRSRLLKLAGHLQAEIHAARNGDTQGQFPILDLIGNLRDETGTHGGPPDLVNLCAEAWERVVRIVESGKDGVLDLVGEMVIAQSLVGQNINDLAGLNPQAVRNIAQLGRITKELQRVSMALRMVPIRGVFQKMSRVVRDIATKQQKKVNFTTSGEDTELDRTVVEELNDPLLHMIRNSMDHGIETPEKRTEAGKPPVGNLALRAYHQGGNIVVEIEDDGAGLNRERILAKAIKRGLARKGEALSDGQIYQFILPPAFQRRKKSLTCPVAASDWMSFAGTLSVSAGAWKFPPPKARARNSRSACR